MIHQDGPDVRSPVLQVAGRTFSDVCVKSGGLTTKQPLTICVAGRAFGNRNSDIRFVACLTLVRERSVCRRQGAGTDRPLKCGGRRLPMVNRNPH